MIHRECIGAMIIKNNKVFVARRISHKSFLQMPQGGIDDNESPEKALYRELQEELGTDKFKIKYKLPFTLSYDFPIPIAKIVHNNKYAGQRLTWFLVDFIGSDHDINIETDIPEFSEWYWINIDELVTSTVFFKKNMYFSLVEAVKSFFA